MNKEGWVSLHKKIADWEWYGDANTFRLFIHLLIHANYADRKWQGNIIKRGQFITSREKISAALKLSISQVRTAEDKLRIADTIAIESANTFTKYSIVKYEDYQGVSSPDSTRIADEIATDSHTNSKPIATTNKGIKEQDNKKVIETREGGLFEKLEETKNPTLEAFEDFWTRFPKTRIGSKSKALQAFHLALKRATLEEIITGFASYPTSSEVRRGFAKGAAAWLNDDRWTNDYSEGAKAAAPGRTSFEEQKKAATTANFDKLMKEKFGGTNDK